MTTKPEYFTIKDAAELLGVTPTTFVIGTNRKNLLPIATL